MTGGSLGLRASGSYGLLQQQAPNGGLQSQNLYIPRRPSKSSLNGYKEKERHIHSIFRYLSQRKVGMLILASLALLAFMTGFFTINKEADLGNSDLDFDTRDPNKSHALSSSLTGKEAMPYNISIKMNKVTVCEENAGWDPSISHASAAVVDSTAASFLDNPCKNFAFPPPPPGDRRRIGPRPCPVCYIPVEHAIASIPKFPSESTVLRHLTYFSEENPLRTEPNGGSEFGGYPSLKQRKDYFDIKESMTVHCGFVKGCGPRDQTGFDIDADDLKELEQFHEVIVASAIFGTSAFEYSFIRAACIYPTSVEKLGNTCTLPDVLTSCCLSSPSTFFCIGNYDVIQQPRNIGEVARKNVRFFMFIDKETEAYMKNTSVLDGGKQVGLWRIIVVHNVPYKDARRNGKVPKLLLHRLFPNVRYSIWIDGKLRLVVDPFQILEKFLWRQNSTFAISRHYSRFDVFEEAEANKAAGKYDNTSIDYQIDYYKKEGLTPYTTDKLPITSDVPEGCVIIREHIPITNLFSCLWFNEVDRFTSRDQLSFATVRDKMKERVNWNINMFLDCERRNFVIQAYHRDLLEQRAHQQAMARNHPPSVLVHEKTPVKRNLVRPGRGNKKPTSRRRRKVIPRNKENFFI